MARSFIYLLESYIIAFEKIISIEEHSSKLSLFDNFESYDTFFFLSKREISSDQRPNYAENASCGEAFLALRSHASVCARDLYFACVLEKVCMYISTRDALKGIPLELGPFGSSGMPFGHPFSLGPAGLVSIWGQLLTPGNMRARRASIFQVNGRCEPEGIVSAYTSEEPKVPSAN